MRLLGIIINPKHNNNKEIKIDVSKAAFLINGKNLDHHMLLAQAFHTMLRKVEAQVLVNEQDALIQADDLVEQYPNNPEAWCLRAYIHALSNQYLKAIHDISTAIVYAPNEPRLYFDRGRYYLKIFDYDNAVNDFCLSVQTSDINADEYYRESSFFLRAYTYLKLDQKAEALNDLEYLRDDFSFWIDEICTKKSLLVLATT